ncbi:hypothetical protein FRC01_008261 [Tulasnella sp. 417]|nr:hypothetical protein FRC01_008261 [Tulasnella sp. 417]
MALFSNILQLHAGQIWRESFDLSFWGEHVYKLVAEGQDACRSLIQQLSRRELVPGGNEMDWVFRKLSKIELIYGEGVIEDIALDAEALLSLVRRRWFGEDGTSYATLALRGLLGIESVEALPIHRLRIIGDELKAAKAIINQQLDQLVARICHRWNTASRVHQLPVEVLAMIFGHFGPIPPGLDGGTSLLDLLLVCRTWHDVIVGSPGLWNYFDAEMPHKIAQLVIGHSQSSPFSVKWHAFNMPVGPKRSGLSNMLDLVIENSTRVQNIDIHISPRDRPGVLKFFSAPIPKLETLRVQVESYVSDRTTDKPPDDIILSDGPPLKHLSLHNVGTQINSPRLSNLVTLRLQGSRSSPPLEDLLPVLSSSRRLEELHIHGYSASRGQIGTTAPVTLPRLKELVLWGVPSRYAVSMLASIYTPRCSHVKIFDGGLDRRDLGVVEALDARVWRPGNDQADVILGRDLMPSWLRIAIRRDWVAIQNPNNKEPQRNLTFARVDVPQMVKRFITILSQWGDFLRLELRLHDGISCRANALDFSSWDERVHSLVAEGRDACGYVTQQLSRRESVPGSNEMDWTFRKLARIKLVYEDNHVEDAVSDTQALLSLVQRRWSGENGLPAATQPSHFEVSCLDTDRADWILAEDKFKRIVPSFELRLDD